MNGKIVIALFALAGLLLLLVISQPSTSSQPSDAEIDRTLEKINSNLETMEVKRIPEGQGIRFVSPHDPTGQKRAQLCTRGMEWCGPILSWDEAWKARFASTDPDLIVREIK